MDVMVSCLKLIQDNPSLGNDKQGYLGVIDVALVSVIRRCHLRDGMPIREIARRTGLSRNTARKHLASGGESQGSVCLRMANSAFILLTPKKSLTPINRLFLYRFHYVKIEAPHFYRTVAL